MATEIFRIEGLEQLQSQLAELMQLGKATDIARGTLVKAARNAMEVVYYDVLTNAPYDAEKPRDARNPIHLRDTVSIAARLPTATDRKSTMINQTDTAIAIVSVKKSAVSLAQELGTKKLAPQPFLRPALERNRDNVVATFKDELQTYINQIAAKQAKRKK